MDKYQVHYENECHSLGMMMRDNSLIDETRLKLKHYMNPHNKNLFKVMKELRNEDKPADMNSLAQVGENKMGLAIKLSCHEFIHGNGI